jgi:glucose dehydrogenase
MKTLRPLLAVLMMALGSGVTAQEISSGTITTSGPMSANLVPVAQSMLNASEIDTKNWLHPNGNYANSRFYPANQINNGNVYKLKPAFIVQTAVVESMQTAPLVVNGVMFLTTSHNHVYAVNAVSGREYWHYKH